MGTFKPEYLNDNIEEFTGLRSKMYCVLCSSGLECKKARGITKSVVQQKLKHRKYNQILQNAAQMHSKITVIISEKQTLYYEYE